LPRARRLHTLGCVPQGRAYGRDDDAAEGYGRERAEEADLEVAPAHPSEDDKLEADDDDREDDRGAIVRDKERQGVEDAAQEGADAGDRAADERVAAAGELAGVGEALGERHAHAGADGRGESREERI